MKKLFVIDLDGTLLDDKKEIGDYTVDTMKRIREEGCLICLASGRCREMMEIYARRIGGCDYMISCNGALVGRMADNSVIYRSCMSGEQSKVILDYAFGHGLEFMMYSVNEMYYSQGSERLKKRIQDYETMCSLWGEPQELNARPLSEQELKKDFAGILKIVVYEENGSKLKAFRDFIKRDVRGVRNESTGYGLMGTFCENVSKYDAVESVKKDAAIGYESVYVFGDYDNDLSMFDCGKHTVAMGNAIEEVKKRAVYLALTNNEQGVAKFINESIFMNE